MLIFQINSLIESHHKAKLPSEREHVTFYMQKENNLKILLTDPQSDLPYLRLTLDTPADLEAIHRLITHPEIIDKPMSIQRNYFIITKFILAIQVFKKGRLE